MAVRLSAAVSEQAALSINNDVGVTLVVEATAHVDPSPDYPGPYEWTPTRSTQVIGISGYKATTNITINPIPPEYGLITWDGSALTVS